MPPDPSDATGSDTHRRGQRRSLRQEETPWRPSAWDALREGRWRLGSGAVAGALVVVAGVVVLLVLGTGVGAAQEPTPTPGVAIPARSGPTSSSLAAAATTATTTAPTTPLSGAPGPSPTEVVVDVKGQVAQPGVVRLPPGARVDDALRAAGGALPSADLRRVNLARPLLDGEQVVVPSPGEDLPVGAAPQTDLAGGTTTGDDDAGAAPATPVDLNTATLTDLDALPGVGPVLAQRILDWRDEHGRFSSVDELGEVAGIGAARLADLSALVAV